MIKEKFYLKNKIAIITGSSKGIGKAMARGLAEFGATVVVSSRKQEAVDQVAEEFTKLGFSATGIDNYFIFGGSLNDLEWTTFRPLQLFQKVEQIAKNALTQTT